MGPRSRRHGDGQPAARRVGDANQRERQAIASEAEEEEEEPADWERGGAATTFADALGERDQLGTALFESKLYDADTTQ